MPARGAKRSPCRTSNLVFVPRATLDFAHRRACSMPKSRSQPADAGARRASIQSAYSAFPIGSESGSIRDCE
jgi:hypothetical protein